MYVVPSISVGTSQLTSSTIPEPDAGAGETAWSAATNYTPGQIAVRTTTHRRYRAVAGGVDATTPETAPESKWIDDGPTNRYAMFDTLRDTQSIETSSPLIVEITLGERADSIGLLKVEATSAQIQVYDGVTLVYDSGSINMSARNTTTWYEYFYGAFRYKPSLALFDLPPISSAKIVVTLTNTSGSVKCGDCIVGMKQYIGNVQYEAEDDETNFSRIDREFDGTAVLTQRRSVPKTNQTVHADKTLVPRLREVRRDLNAIPALWSGLDDSTDDYFDSLLIKGIYRRFGINLKHPSVAVISLELEEI